MSIYKDNRTGIYYAHFIDPSGKRIRKSLKTRNRAVAAMKESELLTKRKVQDSPKVPLQAFLARYREFLSATRKPNTAHRFENGFKKLLSFKPNIEFLDDITPSLVDELAINLKSKIKGDLAPGLNRDIRAIKTAMHQAEFWDLIPPQNWKKVSRFKESKGRVEFHTTEEIKQILKVLNSDWQLVVLLAYQAGLRRGEIAALTWKDIDFKNNQIYVAPNKTEGHRFVPMAARLKKALEAAAKNSKSKYVVEVGESRQSPYFLTAYYCKITKEKLPFKCGLHKLRHTFASHLVQKGVDLYRVSKLLGHSSIKMTEIYAHLAPADLKDAITKLPKIYICQQKCQHSVYKNSLYWADLDGKGF